jgi:hypothetical protein
MVFVPGAVASAVAGVEAVGIWTHVDAPSLHAVVLVWQEGGAAGSMCAGRLHGARVSYDRLRRRGGHAPPEGGGCLCEGDGDGVSAAQARPAFCI